MTNAPIKRTGMVDSLSANEFAVEIDGERATGIFKVSGFASFKLEVKPAITRMMTDTFKIAKMVQRDPNLPFNRWARETIAAKDDINRPKRTLAIIAVDDGNEIRRWTINGAWISEIAYSDFDTGSGELVQETLTIQYESITETWAAS